MDELITAGDRKQAGNGGRGAAVIADFVATAAPTHKDPLASSKVARRIALHPVGTRFSPDVSLAWAMGLLALGACIAPWPLHGWLWFGLIAAVLLLLLCFDALALWLSRDECAPVLLAPEKGIRGREGQTIQLPLALTGSGRRRACRKIRVGIMPATPESQAALRIEREPQRLKLERSNSEGGSTRPDIEYLQFWPWMPEVALLRRGLWRGPRV